jgi:hypothetical protein
MLRTKGNPAPRRTGRASEAFCSAAERSEDNQARVYFQALELESAATLPNQQHRELSSPRQDTGRRASLAKTFRFRRRTKWHPSR